MEQKQKEMETVTTTAEATPAKKKGKKYIWIAILLLLAGFRIASLLPLELMWVSGILNITTLIVVGVILVRGFITNRQG